MYCGADSLAAVNPQGVTMKIWQPAIPVDAAVNGADWHEFALRHQAGGVS